MAEARVRRPSFQFYHGDWRSNAKLRRCNHAQRGIWLEVMCLMADEDEFGVLRWPLADVANAVPCRIAELRVLLERGVIKGADTGAVSAPLIFTPRHAGKAGEPVILLPEQPGPIFYSSRMVRDAYIASIRGKGTRFGEQPKDEPTRRIGDGPSSASSSATTVKKKKPETLSAAARRPAGQVVPLTADVWNAYAQAYQQRYSVPPVRNKRVNGMLAQFVERVGAEEAPAIADFYVRHSRGLYVSARHDVTLLLRDAEGLRTEWATGRRVTDTEARQADRTASTGAQVERLLQGAG
jgi:hypothetical protein